MADIPAAILDQTLHAKCYKRPYEAVMPFLDRSCCEPVKHHFVFLGCSAELIRCRLYALVRYIEVRNDKIIKCHAITSSLVISARLLPLHTECIDAEGLIQLIIP